MMTQMEAEQMTMIKVIEMMGEKAQGFTFEARFEGYDEGSETSMVAVGIIRKSDGKTCIMEVAAEGLDVEGGPYWTIGDILGLEDMELTADNVEVWMELKNM